MRRGAWPRYDGPHEWGQWCGRPMAGWSPFGRLAGWSRALFSDAITHSKEESLTS